MRNIGLANDGYMNFTDVVRGVRRERGLNVWSDNSENHNWKIFKKYKAMRTMAPITDTAFSTAGVRGQTPLDNYFMCHNNVRESWVTRTRRWNEEYERRTGDKPFQLGYHTDIARLKKGDKLVELKVAKDINPNGLVRKRKKQIPGKRK